MNFRDVDIEAQFSLNQSRAEEITMREDYGSLSLVTHDQGFGDMSFDAEPPELLRHGSGMEPSLDQVFMNETCYVVNICFSFLIKLAQLIAINLFFICFV